jgi:hypothetical protein
VVLAASFNHTFGVSAKLVNRYAAIMDRNKLIADTHERMAALNAVLVTIKLAVNAL